MVQDSCRGVTAQLASSIFFSLSAWESSMHTTKNIVRAVLDLSPRVLKDGDWSEAENSSCLAVRGLYVLQHEVLLPKGVHIPRPASPIIEIDQAQELYELAAPHAAAAGVLRPLLTRLMVANDRGNAIEQLTALWVMFDSIATIEKLDRRGAEPLPHDAPGQAIVGSQRLYIKRYRGLRPQQLHSMETAGEVLQARERHPAPWDEATSEALHTW